MEFLIPNNVLDILYCDSCFKFLSVIPVKVFPNKKIKCGRCILKEDDAGVVSRYNFIAEKSIYKCVNRFDGCRKLLTAAEVLEHEKSCQPKQYECPICLEKLNTYLLINHFKVYHKQYYLKTPSFSLCELNEIKKYFLCRYDDNLFFITFDICSSIDDSALKTVYLNCLLIGESQIANNFKVTFSVIFGKISVEKQITCSTVSETREEFTLLLKVNRQNVLGVTFTFDIKKSDNFIPILPQVNSNKIYQKTIKHVTTQTDSSQYFVGDALVILYFQERDIILNHDFKTTFPDALVTSGSTINFSLLNEEICVTLCCFVCCSVRACTFPKPDSDLLYFMTVNGTCYLVCYPCGIARISSSKALFSIGKIKQVSYFCKWKCGEAKNIDELKDHEKHCPKQVLQHCPINSCRGYFKLYEIKDHFKLKHSLLTPPLFGDADNKTDINLNCSKSPLKRIFVDGHLYIHAEFIWEQPFWKITLSCKFPGVKPRAVILTADERYGRYITFIKESGSFRHRDLVRVKCYLTHPDKEEFEKDVETPIDD